MKTSPRFLWSTSLDLRNSAPLSRRVFLRAVLCCWLAGSLAAWAAEPFRLLTIGNSFADNATLFLPDLTKAAGREIMIYKANLGGHSLEQHARYLALYLADPKDPKGRPYPALTGKEKVGLLEALKSQKWDAVSIQQWSVKSPDAASYEPFAG